MAKILIVGALNWDLVIEVDRLPRTGKTVGARAEAERLGGGATNTAVGLAGLEHQVALMGYVGTDLYGDRILAEIQRHGLHTSLIRRRHGPSGRAIIFLDDAVDRAIVLLGGALMKEASIDLWDDDYDALYVAVPRNGYAPLMRTVPKGKKVFATFPSPDTLDWPAHVIMGSEEDLGASIFKQPSDAFSDKRCSVLEWLIVTRGKAGATAYGRDRSVRSLARQVKPIDSTGAGDALAAGVIHCLLTGGSMEEALRYGVDWGTATTLERQSVPATPPEL